jgi:hypothetical protein
MNLNGFLFELFSMLFNTSHQSHVEDETEVFNPNLGSSDLSGDLEDNGGEAETSTSTPNLGSSDLSGDLEDNGGEAEISDLNKELQMLYTEKDALEKKMMGLDVDSEEYKLLEHKFNSVSETVEDNLRELWHLENPDKTIENVLVVTNDIIGKILPILLRIFDSIRRRQSDASVPPELEEYIAGLQLFGHHPPEWSKLVAMLQLPKEGTDSDKVSKVWYHKISCLSVFFFQDKIHSDYRSDFGLLMAIALTNCDEYLSILKTKDDDDLMIYDFFSQCQNLGMIGILEKYPILFFKALDHPVIRSHFLDNPKFETFHDHLWNICLFFESFHSGHDFKAHELDRMIYDLRKVCDILEV